MNDPEPVEESPAPPAKWQVIGASVTGTSHEQRAQPCQDAHRFALHEGNWLIAAVADGAGSARLSEKGSATAAAAAVEALRGRLAAGITGEGFNDDAWRELLLEVVTAAREAVQNEAAALETKPQDLATTLIAVAASPSLVAVVQIGDGAAVVGDRGSKLHSVTQPLRGEYANETVFLTSADALSVAQRNVWRGDAVHLALFSDGLQMLALAMPEGTPHPPFFAPLFQFADGLHGETESQAKLEAFLRSPRVQERTDDDLTLLLAALVSAD